MTDYEGKNYVSTNPSSKTHGRPATLRITRRSTTGPVIVQQRLKGGNWYGISIAPETIPGLVSELIGSCPKAAVPELFRDLMTLVVAGKPL